MNIRFLLGTVKPRLFTRTFAHWAGKSAGANYGNDKYHRRGGDSRNNRHMNKHDLRGNNNDNYDNMNPQWALHIDRSQFDGIYGVQPVSLALRAGKRKHDELFVQTGMDMSKKQDTGAAKILEIALSQGLKITEVSKHDLNMMTDNKLHQGFVLVASKLPFIKLKSMPKVDSFRCILALDEIGDPQNFGALLRTCHFLKVDGVVVCDKNSAPLSESVSKASAGALELMDIGSTNNMMNFLEASKENGWQVIGTALGTNTVSLQDLPLVQPTILILGNEGHGIRTNVLRQCDTLVRIGEQDDSLSSVNSPSVDSLNVSVTGGILLHHIVRSGGGAVGLK